MTGERDAGRDFLLLILVALVASVAVSTFLGTLAASRTADALERMAPPVPK